MHAALRSAVPETCGGALRVSDHVGSLCRARHRHVAHPLTTFGGPGRHPAITPPSISQPAPVTDFPGYGPARIDDTIPFRLPCDNPCYRRHPTANRSLDPRRGLLPPRSFHHQPGPACCSRVHARSVRGLRALHCGFAHHSLSIGVCHSTIARCRSAITMASCPRPIPQRSLVATTIADTVAIHASPRSPGRNRAADDTDCVHGTAVNRVTYQVIKKNEWTERALHPPPHPRYCVVPAIVNTRARPHHVVRQPPPIETNSHYHTGANAKPTRDSLYDDERTPHIDPRGAQGMTNFVLTHTSAVIRHSCHRRPQCAMR